MISEWLVLCVEGRQVNHSWCMGVVSYGYGGLCGWRWWTVSMWVKAKGVGRILGDAGALPECEVIH